MELSTTWIGKFYAIAFVDRSFGTEVGLLDSLIVEDDRLVVSATIGA